MANLGPNITFQSVGPSGAPDIAYSNCYAVIQSPWGIPNQPVICASFADVLRNFGGLTKLASVASGTTADTFTTETNDAVVQAYYALKGYFTEKGTNSPGVAFVSRVAATSSGPTTASKTFADSAGTNLTTVTALWPGIHGATIQATVINPSPRKGVFALQAGTVTVSSGSPAVTGNGTTFQTGGAWVGFGIKIGTEYYTILSVASSTAMTLASNAISAHTADTFSVGNNTTAAYMKFYHPASGIVEEVDIATASDAANFTKQSQLVKVTLPAGGQLPVSAVASKLNTGTPPTADSYAATDADYIGTVTAAGLKTGLQVMNDQKLGTGIVAIPGKTSAAIRSGLKTHAETYYRYAFMGPSAGLTLTTASTEYASVSSNLAAGWAPRVWVQDDNSSSNGQILVDNVGHLAGLQARMDGEYGGPHKSPAGLLHAFRSIIDVERPSGTPNLELFDDSGSQTLADYYVNTIRSKRGIVSYGLRSFAQDERYRQVQVGRTVCLVYLSCFQLMEKKTFEPIDSFGKLYAAIKSDLDSFFFTMWRQGSIFGTQPGTDAKPSDAWFVVCNGSNNPNVQVGKGQVRADVSFVPTLNAESITIPIYVAAPGFGAASAGVL